MQSFSKLYYSTDFAVGAPYDGENGRGAVYIFLGSAAGIRKPHTQVLTCITNSGITKIRASSNIFEMNILLNIRKKCH